jgi:uncharacterized protein YbjT (DUF2867 family)
VNIVGTKLVVIGGAGLIGSHVTEALLRDDVGEVLIFDNFVRGTHENLVNALGDPRCSIYEHGGDIGQTDVLRSALEGADGVFHLAALWLLHCQDFHSRSRRRDLRALRPRAAGCPRLLAPAACDATASAKAGPAQRGERGPGAARGER